MPTDPAHPPVNIPSTPLASASPAAPTPLTHLRAGQTAVIAEARLDVDDAALLRAMGLSGNMRIRVCRIGEPCIVAVGNIAGKHCCCHGHCRIGLARSLADRVFVTAQA